MTEVIAQPKQLTAPDFGLTKFLDPLHIPSVIGPHLWWRQEEITVRAERTRVRVGVAQLTEYPNVQQATTMWYHDHAMAVTRFNVHAGLAGMYLVRDAEEDALDLPHGRHEIPLILTDRNLDTDPATGALTG